MKCPNCHQKMKYKDKGYWGYPFSTGPEPDYPDWIRKDIYKCKDCGIKKINDDWKVPSEYLPTKKQIRTIEFINNRLGMNLETITKRQCCKDIKKYFADAKRPKLSYDDGESYYELQDYFGFCEEDFC